MPPPTVILGQYAHSDGDQVNVARCAVRQITTPGGLNLALAAVADGAGEPGRSDKAAQRALNAFFAHVVASTETNIPRLITRAVQSANQVVLAEGRAHDGPPKAMRTALTVAVLHVGPHDTAQLYIGHVGNSAVYLCRRGRLTKLTIAHTFSTLINVLTDYGVRGSGSAQPEAMVRALGLRERAAVDIGFYVGEVDQATATVRGLNGLPLETGDVVLVCTGALFGRTEVHIGAKDQEQITRVLTRQNGDAAAARLAYNALRRRVTGAPHNPVEGVGIALIQVVDPRAKTFQRVRQQLYSALWVVGLFVILVLVAALVIFSFVQPR
jgi:serine/threonine protein phosphatase PrpC